MAVGRHRQFDLTAFGKMPVTWYQVSHAIVNQLNEFTPVKIIKQGLYDTQFVENYTFGFEGWISADGQVHQGFKDIVLEKYSPKEVERITGIEARKIFSLAKAFAQAEAPIAVCGKGKGILNGSLLEYMAVQSLNALKGSINRPGGVLILDPLPLSPWPGPESDTGVCAHRWARKSTLPSPQVPSP